MSLTYFAPNASFGAKQSSNFPVYLLRSFMQFRERVLVLLRLYISGEES
jgi:hypothetical protein